MAIALRKTLAVATLALTASLLPAATAGATDSAPRTPGRYCLANTWNTPTVSSKPCNTNDPGQHWTIEGEQISLTNARGYCLTNDWGTPNIASRPCNAGNLGQYWSVEGEQISLTNAPAYCLANTWNTTTVSSKPCNTNDPGQHWVIFGDEISLALA